LIAGVALQTPGATHSFPQNSARTDRACSEKKENPVEGSALAQFLPLILIFAIMYFLLIRPQQKKMKEHQAMVDAVRRGDQIVTAGGLIGKVAKVKEDGSGEVEVEISDGVKVRLVKATISQVINKTEPTS